ncbi:SgrR family transcriptional regulator [Vibrio agarivorans]|uniref:SgrR family transcriptional regulator n=1 Tax=Vibrio agarivorans TaxID=153622 RepID=UPI0022328744|nr:SgrR family transcriptional regulator [Vibrio agarivorans]
MSSPRLRVQFETLFEHFDGQDTQVRIEDITEILFCTRRNARIVLNRMDEEGWIEWQPAPGRGKLSQLNFKRSRSDVSQNMALRYLEEGKFEHALGAMNNDSAKLAQVIEGYLGVQHREGEQVIRLPYYRPLSMLNPRMPMRRSEQHIAHQIFSGLTKLDDKDQLSPDLSHTWEMIDERVWRFYLRPNVRFHNGTVLSAQHVIDSLENLKQRPLFDTIERIESPSPLVVDIVLNFADRRLPLLLAETCAKILPTKSEREEQFDLVPVGTGPYKVVRNDDQKLVLHAFDGYFGYRALVDVVEVWVIDEAHSSLIYPSVSNPMQPQTGQMEQGVELDPGCIYLLLNQRSGLAKDPQWANYFSNKFNALSLFRELPSDIVTKLGILPAHGLKPGWLHHTNCDDSITQPNYQTVTIAYHNRHPTYPDLVKALESRLKQDGLRVEFIAYDIEPDNIESIDIWIKPMGIANHRDDALAGWLLDSGDIQRLSSDERFSEWKALVSTWRLDSKSAFPAHQLGKALIEQNQIVPLFHCWLGVNQEQCGSLQNAQCNALGWFDFSNVWVRPELDSK